MCHYTDVCLKSIWIWGFSIVSAELPSINQCILRYWRPSWRRLFHKWFAHIIRMKKWILMCFNSSFYWRRMLQNVECKYDMCWLVLFALIWCWRGWEAIWGFYYDATKIVSSAIAIPVLLVVYNKYRIGQRTLPCRTPDLIGTRNMCASLHFTRKYLSGRCNSKILP